MYCLTLLMLLKVFRCSVVRNKKHTSAPLCNCLPLCVYMDPFYLTLEITILACIVGDTCS